MVTGLRVHARYADVTGLPVAAKGGNFLLTTPFCRGIMPMKQSYMHFVDSLEQPHTPSWLLISSSSVAPAISLGAS
jgi:hypothetical protein